MLHLEKCLRKIIFNRINLDAPLKSIIFFICTYLVSTITVAQPNFTASPLSGCAPLLVRFTDQTPGATAWDWDLGNGTKSTQQHPSTTYVNGGQFTVRLIVTVGGVKDTLIRSNYITIYPVPVTAFTSTDSVGCFPLRVQFTDQSSTPSGSLTKWEWDFGDGITSTDRNPFHVYTIPGTFNVTLKVTNSFGCVSSRDKFQYIQIADGVTAAFINSFPASCKPPINIEFFNQSTGPGTLSYNWNFGDGGTSTNPNPIHNYNAVGDYTVMLVASSSDGCIDTLIKQVSITADNTQSSFDAPDTICRGTTVDFRNTSLPIPDSSFWDFGDGTSQTAFEPSHRYNVAGPFTVTLRNIFGTCSDTVSKTIYVVEVPNSDFTLTNNISCGVPLTVNFQSVNTDSTASHVWGFGTGGLESNERNPSYTYTSPGLFRVRHTVIDARGCSSITSKPDIVKIIEPTVEITNLPDSGCVPFTITPTPAITSSDGIASYEWDFGDGNTSTAANPSHTYTTPGIFTLRLVITTNGGCKDSVILVDGVKAGNPPTADFSGTPLNLCAGSEVNFTDLTTGTVTGWYWEFGDGGTSTDKDPIYSYTDTGIFTVKLTAFHNGCPNVATKSNYVQIRGAVARFTDSINCSNKTEVLFTENSINAATWDWDFGDGTTSNQTGNFIHTFPGLGTYTVALTVTNAGCTYLLERIIKLVDERADYLVTPSTLCKEATTFFSTVGIDTANITAYYWDYGNGVFIPGQDTSQHTYDSIGFYNSRLKITDINGCSDSTIKPIAMGGPTAYFRPLNPTGCKGLTVNFKDSSITDGLSSISSWLWIFGDGSTSTDQNPSHTYLNAGNYTVTLKITDAAGCSDSVEIRNAVITSDPKAVFNAMDTVSCPGRPVQFLANPTGSSVNSYLWSFGDGTISIQRNPIHIYDDVGTYSVKLRVGDRFGCADSLTKVNYIRIDTPYAAFDVSDSIATCPPLQVKFTYRGRYNKTVRWDFGDGGGSALLNPEHFYNRPGTYRARLIVTSPGGCTDTAFKTIVVFGPDGVITYGPPDGCAPLSINFSLRTSFVDSVIWDFDDGVVNVTKDTVLSYTYTDSGSYLPRVLVQDISGCRVPILGIDTVKVVKIFPDFTVTDQLFCDRADVQFKDSTISNGQITGWQWDFGDGTSSTEQNPIHTYTTTGNYNVTLTVTTEFGCSQSVTKPNFLRIVSSPVTDIVSDTAVCQLSTITFSGIVVQPDTSALTWSWDFANGQTSNLQNPPGQTYAGAGNYLVQMLVTNSSGCVDTVTKNITIHPLPPTDAGPDTTICLGQSTILNATGAATYLWLPPATNLSCTNCAQPSASPTTNTTYLVRGTSTFGCESIDSMRVQVVQPSTVSAPQDDSLCLGQALQLFATGTQVYSWSPPDGLNNASISSPVARPTNTTTYVVTGSDTRGCFVTSDSVTITVFPIPTVNAGPDITIPVGSSTPLSANPSPDVLSILWTPATGLTCTVCPNPVATPKVSTTYSVQVTNEGNCTSSDEVTIFVVCTNGNLFVPNTFSPNGDGQNEVFYPRGRGISIIKGLRIFNRWGQLVFEKHNFDANDISSGWNGTFKGAILTPDVYVYILDVLCENNQVLTLKGDVTLIR
jgi:gliding motility-associated-like protein